MEKQVQLTILFDRSKLKLSEASESEFESFEEVWLCGNGTDN